MMHRTAHPVAHAAPHAHDPRRRAVCAGLLAGPVACLLGAGPALGATRRQAATAPVTPAMARLGARLAGDLPLAALRDLRRLAAALRGTDAPALGARIAADFRAGRTVALRGVALSRTEAACFLAAAEHAADAGSGRGARA